MGAGLSRQLTVKLGRYSTSACHNLIRLAHVGSFLMHTPVNAIHRQFINLMWPNNENILYQIRTFDVLYSYQTGPYTEKQDVELRLRHN